MVEELILGTTKINLSETVLQKITKIDVSQRATADIIIRKLFKYQNLKRLECNDVFIQIKDFINLPDIIEELICTKCNLVSVSKWPTNLTFLDCSNNKLTNLDNLPSGLKILYCKNNKLTNLDYLPISLEQLDCSYNKIKNLDFIPQNVFIINCSKNNIENLNNLPSSVKILDCKNNPIKNYDNLDFIEFLVKYIADDFDDMSDDE